MEASCLHWLTLTLTIILCKKKKTNICAILILHEILCREIVYALNVRFDEESLVIYIQIRSRHLINVNLSCYNESIPPTPPSYFPAVYMYLLQFEMHK